MDRWVEDEKGKISQSSPSDGKTQKGSNQVDKNDQSWNSSELHRNNGQLRILVVDDDENIREILKDLLTMSDHRVTLAGDGEKALEVFTREEFDLVFTDLGMPGISGWEVNRRIKENHPEKPVIIISGWGAQLSEEEIRNNRADYVIPKPFTLDQILSVIERFGKKRTSEDEWAEIPGTP